MERPTYPDIAFPKFTFCTTTFLAFTKGIDNQRMKFSYKIQCNWSVINNTFNKKLLFQYLIFLKSVHLTYSYFRH